MIPVSPLTNTNEIKHIKDIAVDNLCLEWKNRYGIDVSGDIGHNSIISLYECSKTHLQFFTPADVAGSGAFYSSLQQYDWYYIPHKWEHDMALNDINFNQRVIEVGSGFGTFVQRLTESRNVDATGLELNPTAVSVARSNGRHVVKATIEEVAQNDPGSYDVLCAFQVLEHVPNIKEFLWSCIDATRKGGALLFCVPNSDSFLKYQHNLLDLPPHHMSRWSKFTFQALENLFPIKLEKVLFEPLAYYHINGYIDAYRNHYRSFRWLGKLAFNRYTIPFYKKSLNRGLRMLTTGQSLYVQFRKI
ncbi:MAG: methyltransferase domain-containing protein [Caldilinea sp. CFX5]|nr:methyltransferase domain-containing protein [Caldilinea sp. CFX5]